MRLHITGDIRDIANSAWVSTLNEVRAASKSEEEVLRVVKFLVENHHTSPFECITLTFEMNIWTEKGEMDSYFNYLYDPYTKFDENEEKITIDLLNFVKITHKNNGWSGQAWELFRAQQPILASLLEKFEPVPNEPAETVDELLGEHQMAVELINYHDGGNEKHQRATWRIKCPLSIAVQIQRHRTGSFNASSSRYRTVDQDFINTTKDCKTIADKADLNIQELMYLGKYNLEVYRHFMSKAKNIKDLGVISSEEYKRLRECARFILPEGRLTEFYVTFYLSDFFNNYKKLRDSKYAQIEHIWIVQQMSKTLKEYVSEKR